MWQPAPFYDITYSTSPYNEHSTSFAGYGKQPPLQAIQELASIAGFSWQEARLKIQEIVEIMSNFKNLAKQYPIPKYIIQEITTNLDAIRKENKVLFS